MYTLSKHNMKKAKDLARELVRVQKEKEMRANMSDSFGVLKESIIKVFGTIKDTVLNAWEEIKEAIKVKEENEQHDFNWYVPFDTTKISQVKMPNIYTPNIRRGI